MKVWKAGVLNNSRTIELYVNTNPGDIAFYLSKLEYRFSSFACTTLILPIPKALEANEIRLEIEIPKQMLATQHRQPIFLCNQEPFWDRVGRIHSSEARFLGICLYQNHLYCAETDSINKYSADEAIRLIKEQVAYEERSLKRIRQEIMFAEKLNDQRSEYSVASIPEHVRLSVIARDNGQCIRCGTRDKIIFDHIVPLAQGGSNTESNIQILCQVCRLKKPDNIIVLNNSTQ